MHAKPLGRLVDVAATALADTFESHRSHLLAVGYRLTGSVTDAEDAVQESWLRLANTEQDSIRDLRGWLTTVVGRICLDRLRSAAVRRESYIGQWLPEPIVLSAGPSREPDPLEAVVAGEENRFAALVVLDTLTPQQRVAFVLHDGFSVPFDEVADILDISVASARKLASRARSAVSTTPPPVPTDEHDKAVAAFLEAMATGDIDAIVASLLSDAKIIGDANGTTTTAINVITGATKIARFFVGLTTKFGRQRFEAFYPVSVNGELGLYQPAGPDYPARVMGFTVVDGRVAAAYDMANPEKLVGVRL